MKNIVIFAESVSAELIAGAFPQLEPLIVNSKSECAAALVSGAAIDCLVVQRDAYGQEYQSFLASIKKHFSLLEVLLITPKAPTSLPEGCHFVDGSTTKRLLSEITAFSRAIYMSDHRQGIRFDWPLGGLFSWGSREIPCKVRSLSSSGAFLEMAETLPAATTPEAATEGVLKVEFLNSRMSVKCEIARRQDAGHGAPAGCGVRFVELSSRAQEFCERIICDAVVQALLSPEEEKRIPTLFEEDLLIPGFDPV